MAELVLHINREMLHHGAEIALLRDLYLMALRRQGSRDACTSRSRWSSTPPSRTKLADFWAFALDYVLEPPPHGFETWEDFGRSIGMPEEEFGDQAAVIDPADEGPRIYFQRVPERKTVKNRVHLDIRVAGREIGGEERKQLVSEKVEQLVQAGASVAWGERGRAGTLDRAARPGGQRVLRDLSGPPAAPPCPRSRSGPRIRRGCLSHVAELSAA